jgi:acyl carrier protein
MSIQERVRRVVEAAIDEVNLTLHHAERLGKTPDVRLVGDGGGLDSLGLVNLIVALEEKLKLEFRRDISLTDMVMTQGHSGLRTIGDLCQSLSDRIESDNDGVQ